MSQHLEDLAELYALGALDDAERRGVDRHVRTCAACAKRLGEAESAVVLLAQASPAHAPGSRLERRSRAGFSDAPNGFHWRSALAAAAAALVLALIPAWLAVERTRDRLAAMQQDERALARIASSPFERASFIVRPSAGAMDAKVLYGPDGSWYYVIVTHPKPNMQVAYVHDGRMEMLGTVAMHGDSGTLFLPVNHKMPELALLDAGQVVADAHLAY